MAKITCLTPTLCRYMLRHRTEESAPLAALRRETAHKLGPVSGMMISEEQGVLLRLLAGVLCPRFAVEVGTFTGYSAACIAQGMPVDGRLLCCDVSEEWTSIGRKHWPECGVEDRIELRIGPALDTLRALPGDPAIDFAFVDADKDRYIDYFEEILPRTRRNGLLAFDNVLWHNWSLDASNQAGETVGIREFNAYVRRDARVESVMLHVGDGLTLIRKL